jgi:CheY-like chemotaxis protein
METSEEEITKTGIGLIMLLDDIEADNEFHRAVIQSAGLSWKSISITHPLEALTYFKNCLTERPNVHYPVPDLVFLDLMMPAYDGFELLDQFKELPDPYDRKKKMKFVLLTGTVNPEISLRAKTDYSDLIIACAQKPLEASVVLQIAEKDF